MEIKRKDEKLCDFLGAVNLDLIYVHVIHNSDFAYLSSPVEHGICGISWIYIQQKKK